MQDAPPDQSPLVTKGSNPPIAPAGGTGLAYPPFQQELLIETMDLATFAALPAAMQISLRRYGRRTRTIPNDFTLAAAVAAIVANNSPDRVGINVTNSGVSNPATVTADGTKSVTQGDPLDAGGSSYSASALEDGDLVTRELWAISTLGSTIHVEEVIAYGPLVALPAGVTPL